MDPDHEIFTKQGAFDRVERHIQAAVELIEPRPELQDREMGEPQRCDDVEGYEHTYLVERSYRLAAIEPDRNEMILNTLHDFWTGHGYVVLRDLRQRHRARQLHVRHPYDGFSVSIRENVQGGLSLTSSSPCILLSDYAISPTTSRTDLTPPAD